MKKCFYCKRTLEKNFIENKVGYFCSEDHFNKYVKSLSKEDYIDLMNSFCTCSDD